MQEYQQNQDELAARLAHVYKSERETVNEHVYLNNAKLVQTWHAPDTTDMMCWGSHGSCKAVAISHTVPS